MRISTVEARLALVLAGLPLAAATTQRVTFPIGSFQSEARQVPNGVPNGVKFAVYDLAPNQSKNKTFDWAVSDENVKVRAINLCLWDNSTSSSTTIRSNNIQDSGSGENGDSQGTTSSSAAATGKLGGLTPATESIPLAASKTDGLSGPPGTPGIPGGSNKRDSPKGLQQPRLIVSVGHMRGTVLVEDLQSLLDHKGKILFFEAVWSDAGGKSYSRAFTVMDGGFPSSGMEVFRILESDLHPFMPDDVGNTSGMPQGTETGRSPTSTGFPSSGASSGGGSDLQAGAIAGIAVGGAAFLGFIIFIVWFFLRRRRQSNEEATLDPYGHGRTRTDELMAEKEANAGVDAAPHSPYSDEGGANSLHQVNAAAIPPIMSHHRDLSQQPLQQAHDVPRSYTPYSDHPSGTLGSPESHSKSIAAADIVGRDGNPIPGRVTPHGMTPYAHLVEEGMTEEEIKRLEEEERALDAAIEQAGRRP